YQPPLVDPDPGGLPRPASTAAILVPLRRPARIPVLAQIDGAAHFVAIHRPREIVGNALAFDPMGTPEAHRIGCHRAADVARGELAAMRAREPRALLLQEQRVD